EPTEHRLRAASVAELADALVVHLRVVKQPVEEPALTGDGLPGEPLVRLPDGVRPALVPWFQRRAGRRACEVEDRGVAVAVLVGERAIGEVDLLRLLPARGRREPARESHAAVDDRRRARDEKPPCGSPGEREEQPL